MYNYIYIYTVRANLTLQSLAWSPGHLKGGATLWQSPMDLRCLGSTSGLPTTAYVPMLLNLESKRRMLPTGGISAVKCVCVCIYIYICTSIVYIDIYICICIYTICVLDMYIYIDR